MKEISDNRMLHSGLMKDVDEISWEELRAKLFDKLIVYEKIEMLYTHINAQ
jgi:hypothetical protein